MKDVKEVIVELYDTVNAHGHKVGRLLVKPVVIDNTINGFKLADVDQKKDRPDTSEIIMVSPGAYNTHKEGDIVLHNRFSSLNFTHDGQQYLLITTDDAYAKYKP